MRRPLVAVERSALQADVDNGLPSTRPRNRTRDGRLRVQAASVAPQVSGRSVSLGQGNEDARDVALAQTDICEFESHLFLPKIKSAHNDDAIRTEFGW
jgi:hypothetical protein